MIKKIILKSIKKIIFLLILIINLELGSFLLLKLNLFKNFNHSNLTFSFTEIDENNFMNLKKNVILIKDVNIFTDKNRLRVKKQDYQTNLTNDMPKIVILGDSVPFGWGLNYENSISGHLETENRFYQIINGSVPSYTPKQSVKKFIEELSNIRNIKYLYISNFNPIDLYLVFGEKWNENINWSNYINYLSEDLFFFKYKSLLYYGEINFFKFLRKIYIIKYFKHPNNYNNIRSLESDLSFINFYTEQLKKLDFENIKIIYSSIISPLHLTNNADLKNDLDIEKKKLINKINLNLKNYENGKFIFLDAVDLIKDYKKKDIFIDECCHLTSKGSQIIANGINDIISKDFN